MKWPLVTLEDVATIERRGIDPASLSEEHPYVGLEHIESGGRLLNVVSVTRGDLKSTKFVFGPDHILYGKLRPYLAKIALPDFQGICSTDILPVLPGPRIDKHYLCHYLRQPSMVDFAASRSEGANLPRLSPKSLGKFEIPLPPLDEQKRIAAILDKADALRRKRRQALALLDSLTQSIFLEMFGDLTACTDRWPRCVALSEVAEISSGITKGRKASSSEMTSVPYLAVANVQDKMLNLDSVKTIEATKAEIDKFKIQSDDLLLTEGGDPDKLGRGTLWRNELPLAIHQNHIFKVRFTTDIVDPLYANWLIGSAYGKIFFLKSAKKTTGIASINKNQLSAFPMILPPIDVQRKFAQKANAVSTHKQAQMAHLDYLEICFSALQTRAFGGGI